jgi:glycine/D-amino acid oxidase-like deaminating enzyme
MEAVDPVAGDDAVEAAWVPLEEVAEMTNLVDGLAEFLHEHGVLDVIV